jgi:hypothetical protein
MSRPVLFVIDDDAPMTRKSLPNGRPRSSRSARTTPAVRLAHEYLAAAHAADLSLLSRG